MASIRDLLAGGVPRETWVPYDDTTEFLLVPDDGDEQMEAFGEAAEGRERQERLRSYFLRHVKGARERASQTPVEGTDFGNLWRHRLDWRTWLIREVQNADNFPVEGGAADADRAPADHAGDAAG